MKNAKVIAILSQKDDLSTHLVYSYLINFKFSCVIFYDIEQLYMSIFTQMNSFFSIWLRRQNFRNYLNTDIKLVNESTVLNFYYHYKCERHPNVLGSILKDYKHNKLIDLDKAKNCGLEVPNTKIVNSKGDLINLLECERPKRYITKAMFNHKKFVIDGKTYSGGFPTELDEIEIASLDKDWFFPSLVQEYIDKAYEIRIFYLDGIFYPMAIFSQKDPKTQLDFRNYNENKPNRNIPFKLSNSLELKLTNFMTLVNIRFGSIDMICTKNNQLVFLEVNPVGQFGWLSENCNYYLEKHIASYLINF